jgi:hypothetical protein
MMRIGAVSVVVLGLLSACGHTPEERLASGLLLGAAAGAVIGVASDPHFGERHGRERHYEDRHHKRRHYGRHRDHGGNRRHRDYDDYYDDYDDCCYK